MMNKATIVVHEPGHMFTRVEFQRMLQQHPWTEAVVRAEAYEYTITPVLSRNGFNYWYKIALLTACENIATHDYPSLETLWEAIVGNEEYAVQRATRGYWSPPTRRVPVHTERWTVLVRGEEGAMTCSEQS